MADDPLPSYPLHSVDVCHVCGCGLCGIRICGLSTEHPHGLIICDECEALWTEPNTHADPIWRDAENPTCPICGQPLWGPDSRWANRGDLVHLGWQKRINPILSIKADR